MLGRDWIRAEEDSAVVLAISIAASVETDTVPLTMEINGDVSLARVSVGTGDVLFAVVPLWIPTSVFAWLTSTGGLRKFVLRKDARDVSGNTGSPTTLRTAFLDWRLETT
jgi:hypothetical protein